MLRVGSKGDLKSPNRKDVEIGKITLSLDSGDYTWVHLCPGLENVQHPEVSHGGCATRPC